MLKSKKAESIAGLVSILSYKRAAGSKTLQQFNRKFLEPVFGQPDAMGNYTLEVGRSDIIFSAHHDSVHKSGGMQKVELKRGIIQLPKDSTSNCLGADDGTGIWLILAMIEAGVAGRYVIHAEEESGCIGSRWLVENRPEFWQGAQACIAFDRRGKDSVITHQSNGRTASDSFAESLASILALGMRPDPTGSFTDSNEYAGVVPECTNVSVGYGGAHSASETQDSEFAWRLRGALIAADWDGLTIERDPNAPEPHWRDMIGDSWDSVWDDWQPARKDREKRNQFETMVELIEDNPAAVAVILEELGYDARGLSAEIAEMLFGGRN